MNSLWIQTPSSPVPTAAPAATTSEGRATAFRAVEGGGNTRSGAILMVEAYVVIWLLVMFLVWRTMRRLGQIDGRIAQLESDLKARGEADADGGGAAD